jgi:hypothetical protein
MQLSAVQEVFMTTRSVKDTAGRNWTCSTESKAAEANQSAQGRDIILSCATESVSEPVRVTVGWQWESMAAPGLARLITLASPVPRT